MNNLVIAEKPNVAVAIADAIPGTLKKMDGYFIKGDYYITWAYGHLLRLKTAEEYDPEKYTKWTLEQLPIYFENWQNVPNENGVAQLEIIKGLLKEAAHVIHAGDPDDEGQLLIDEIINYCGYTGKVSRVLINDNNTEQVKKALSRMEDNAKYIPEGRAAHARQISDMVFGVSLSRYYSCAQHAKVSVGRVQTPTLGLIVNRDHIIEDFKKIFYYIVYANVTDSGSAPATIRLRWKPAANDENLTDGKVLEKTYADQKAESISGRNITVSITSKEKKTSPPLPWNLTKLQAYASKTWSYDPSDTLKITQDLREKYKAITYNRSDCQYLNSEHHREAPGVVGSVLQNYGIQVSEIPGLDFSIKGKCFDDAKVSAHHAIIPTSTKVNLDSMSEAEKNIYRVISDYYIVQFLPDMIHHVKTATVDLGDGEQLTASAKKMTVAGFKVYMSGGGADEAQESEDEDTKLSSIPDGTYQMSVASCDVEQKETAPPKRYTVADLIMDMSQIAKYVTDPDIKAILKKKDDGKEGEKGGIGTSATRAKIIDTLLDPARGFIERNGDKLISTDKARVFYAMLPVAVKTADVTAQWWLIQEEIKSGEANEQNLIDSVLATVREVLTGPPPELQHWGSGQSRESIGKCPVCGSPVYEYNKVFACEQNRDRTCPFVVFKNNKFFESKGKVVTPTAMKSFLTSGHVRYKGLKKKDGKGTYDATIALKPMKKDDKWVNFELEFENKKK
jgi:DNA topoisomerase-3